MTAMTFANHARFLMLIFICFGSLASAQDKSSASIKTCRNADCVTITEPGRVKVEELWKQADLVAVVKIVSGDTENYPSAICKAKISVPFKGIEKSETIYVRSCNGYGLGNEYLAFLRRATE